MVILNEGNVYKLKLKSIGLKDAGEIAFQCGDLKDRCKIFVKESKKPPRIDATRFGKSVTIKAGRPLDLEIPYDAYPAPTMVWLKDGKPVQPGDGSSCQTSIDAKRCKLNIEKSKRGDTGKYELILKNAKGEVKIPIDVTVLDIERGTREPAGEVNEDNTSLQGEGEPLEETNGTTLAKNSYDEPSAPGKLEISDWNKDRGDLEWQALDKDSGVFVEKYIIKRREKGLTDLSENGEVEFRVKAVNKAGESEPSSTTGRVKITEYPNGRAPTFVKKLTDTSAPLNREATFTIEFDANPAPEVKWFRNGLELITGGRCRITTNADESKSILTFTETWERDNNSKISCEIVNPLGRDTCDAVFHVKTPPKLTREPEEQRVPLGDTLKVKIPISGKGPFKFQVNKDGQSLANDDRVRIQEFDDFIVVTIP
ncbi:unnamed protein product, partial [Adineta steineri]